MENETKSETILSIYCLNHIAKKQHGISPTDSSVFLIRAADACEAALLSWKFQEVVLSKAHNIRVTSKSKSLRADQELMASLVGIEELAGFDLLNGDPGLRLLEMRGYTISAGNEIPTGVLFFESVETVKKILIDAKHYDFLKSRKRKLVDEFNKAVSSMRKHASHFGIPVRLDDNAFVDGEKKARSKVSKDFLDKYPSQQSNLSTDQTESEPGSDGE